MQAEDKFTSIREALKTVNKLDLDKLISSVKSNAYGLRRIEADLSPN